MLSAKQQHALEEQQRRVTAAEAAMDHADALTRYLDANGSIHLSGDVRGIRARIGAILDREQQELARIRSMIEEQVETEGEKDA